MTEPTPGTWLATEKTVVSEHGVLVASVYGRHGITNFKDSLAEIEANAKIMSVSKEAVEFIEALLDGKALPPGAVDRAKQIIQDART